MSYSLTERNNSKFKIVENNSFMKVYKCMYMTDQLTAQF